MSTCPGPPVGQPKHRDKFQKLKLERVEQNILPELPPCSERRRHCVWFGFGTAVHLQRRINMMAMIMKGWLNNDQGNLSLSCHGNGRFPPRSLINHSYYYFISECWIIFIISCVSVHPAISSTMYRVAFAMQANNDGGIIYY